MRLSDLTFGTSGYLAKLWQYFDVSSNRDSIRGRVMHGAFWTLLGSTLSQGAGVLGSILSARILGKVGFGELGIIRSTVLMFGVLAGTGLGMASTKYVAEFRLNDPAKAGRMIGLLLNAGVILGGSVTLVCLFLSAPLADSVMHAPHLAGALQIGCLLLLLTTLNGVQLGVVCGFEAFRTQSRVIVLDGMFNLLLVPAGAFVYGVAGAVGGSVLAALLGFMVKQQAMNKECRRSAIHVVHRHVSAEFPALWRFVLPAILLGVSIQPFEWLARIMLVQQPNGYAELGIFTAVVAWAQLILFLPGQVSGPIMPIMANLLADGQVARLKKVILSSQGLISVVTVMTAVPLAIFAPYILRAYGPDFITGSLTLWTMIGAYIICVPALITRSFFAAADRMWWQTIHTFIWGMILLAGCKFLIHYGGLGLAFSYLGAYVTLTVLQFGTQAVIVKKLSK